MQTTRQYAGNTFLKNILLLKYKAYIKLYLFFNLLPLSQM